MYTNLKKYWLKIHCIVDGILILPAKRRNLNLIKIWSALSRSVFNIKRYFMQAFGLHNENDRS